MKPYLLITLLISFLLLNVNEIQSQTTQPQLKQVCLDNTEQFSIESKYVKGENYIIQVGLPIGYSPTKKSYPVLYVLDGDKSFGMTKEITDWLIWSNEIREIIVVAITYGKGTDEWWQKRARDYSHGNDTTLAKGWFRETGGADNFLKFVRNELFPTINKNYKTNQDSTAIMGLSFGGTLVTYALFTQPNLFKNYILISPALAWNDNDILKIEKEYFMNNKELNKTVYVAYGSMDSKEWVINSTNEFIQTIQNHKYEGFKFVSRIFEGETHISVYPTALTNGLKNIYPKGK
jgi:predicted alpha/beta superfamily hydrolase